VSDLDERRWLIPPERFKSDAFHIVPLTAPVIELTIAERLDFPIKQLEI
jgi:hypothetical protein